MIPIVPAPRTLAAAALLGVSLILVPAAPLEAQNFRRGDCSGDGGVDIGDAITALGILFSGGAPAACQDACDANDDGNFDIGDAVAILAALFGIPSVPLPAPYPGCGEDLTADALGCVSSPCPLTAIHVAPTGVTGNPGSPTAPVPTLASAITLMAT